MIKSFRIVLSNPRFSLHDIQLNSIICGFLEHHELEITGKIFYCADWTDEVDDLFWKRLKSQITWLTLKPFEEIYETGYTGSKRGLISKLLTLHNLKDVNLWCKYVKKITLSEFLQNTALETFEVLYPVAPVEYFATDFYDKDVENEGAIWVSKEIVDLVRYCPTLKQLLIPCKISYNFATLNEILSAFNFNCLKMDEIVLSNECPKNGKFGMVRSLMINLIKENETSKAIVDVQSLQMNITLDVGDNLERGTVCFYDHLICLNDKLQTLVVLQKLESSNICLDCWENMLKSFPTILHLYFLPGSIIDHHQIVDFMSEHLRSLSALSLDYACDLMRWPKMPLLTDLGIAIYSTVETEGQLAKLFVNCTKLRKLEIEFSKTTLNKVSPDKFPLVIGCLISTITDFFLDKRLKLTEAGLENIAKYMKNLMRLKIGCNEEEFVIRKLFSKLTYLKTVHYINQAQESVCIYPLSTVESHNGNVALFESAIQDYDQSGANNSCNLPEEVWVKIFNYLRHNDQVRCRAVCSTWTNLLSSHSLFKNNRILPLYSSSLSMTAVPCKTFINTTFNYDLLILFGELNIQGDISRFWKHLGSKIRRLFITYTMDIENCLNVFESGLNISNFTKLELMAVQLIDLLKEWEQNEQLLQILQFIKVLEVHRLEVTNVEYWPCLPNIERLECCVVTEITELGTILAQKLPSVSFLCIQWISMTHSIDHLYSLLSKLSYLELGIEKISKDFFEYLKSNCFNLKTIVLSATNIDQFDLRSEAEKLFLNLNLLHEISFGKILNEKCIIQHKSHEAFKRHGKNFIECISKLGNQTYFFYGQIDTSTGFKGRVPVPAL